jgi:hypothetical protein
METVSAVMLTAVGVVALVGMIVWTAGVNLDLVRWLRSRKRAAVERELDRTQAALRLTILHLARELGADAHDARKALIQEAFLASGKATRDR